MGLRLLGVYDGLMGLFRCLRSVEESTVYLVSDVRLLYVGVFYLSGPYLFYSVSFISSFFWGEGKREKSGLHEDLDTTRRGDRFEFLPHRGIC